MNNRKCVGIIGGTFNPIHNGHLMLGEYSLAQYQLDEVWYMPNGEPPHKSDKSIQSMTEHRKAMVELAIAGRDRFRICEYELLHEGKSYTAETLPALRKLYPDVDFCFIIGADSLATFESWYHPDIILANAVILAAYRDDLDTPQEMYDIIEHLHRKYSGDIRLIRTPLVDASSTEIREQIAEGKIDDLPLPDAVKRYIFDHHLYQRSE